MNQELCHLQWWWLRSRQREKWTQCFFFNIGIVKSEGKYSIMILIYIWKYFQNKDFCNTRNQAEATWWKNFKECWYLHPINSVNFSVKDVKAFLGSVIIRAKETTTLPLPPPIPFPVNVPTWDFILYRIWIFPSSLIDVCYSTNCFQTYCRPGFKFFVLTRAYFQHFMRNWGGRTPSQIFQETLLLISL